MVACQKIGTDLKIMYTIETACTEPFGELCRQFFCYSRPKCFAKAESISSLVSCSKSERV